ncbi:MAG: hypothetical protein GY774_10640 [Planctomycetes bacterium]|nr:hypothetical protein [Planctomycetota bacterium]
MTRNLEISSQALDIGTVSGINNVSDASRLAVSDLVYASNIDISDKGKPSRRDGYTKKFTPAGSVHSMWGDDKVCLFVEAGVLKMLNADYSATILRTGVSDYRMRYDEVNDKYFYTNPSVIGYIYNGVDNQFATPTGDYKHAPLPGQHIAYYNGRLYVARNETIWYSDVNEFGEVDRRMNFLSFENEVTMMKAVDDGLWVCVGDINRQATYFIQGATREDQTLRRFAGYGCIEGSDVKIKDGQKVGEGLSGTVIMWTSDGGICIGANGGRFINVTDGRYNTPDKRYGAGLFRDEGGLAQYISVLWE